MRTILSVVLAASPVPGPAGPSWRAIRVHDQGGCDALTRIVPVSKTDVWVFGQSEPIDDECRTTAHPTAQHWDGSAWRTVKLPGKVYGVAGSAGASSSRDVWVFVTNDTGTYHAMHYDGRRWKDTGRSGIELGLVLGQHHVWGFGRPSWFWNGWSWGRAPRVPFLPEQVSMSSGQDAWAIVYNRVAHFDGHRWKRVRLGAAMPASVRNWSHELRGVLAVGKKDVWLFGHSTEDNVADGRELPFTLHFDGSSWARVAMPDLPGWSLGHATSDGKGGIDVIGYPPGEGVAATVLSRSAAGVWTTSTPQVGGKVTELWDLARIPGTSEIWAVGSVSQSDTDTTSAVFAR